MPQVGQVVMLGPIEPGAEVDHTQLNSGFMNACDQVTHLVISCAPGQIRTADTRFRRAVLYPLSYGGQVVVLNHDHPV